MVSFPYSSHTTPIRIPKDMGIVWEAYHKGVPLLGVPENPIDVNVQKYTLQTVGHHFDSLGASCQHSKKHLEVLI